MTLLHKAKPRNFNKRSTKLSRRIILRWKLSPNPTKSETKIFTLRKYKNPTVAQINNQEIQWNSKDDSVKYLGVYLDEKLTWKIYINITLNQEYTRMKILYSILNHSSTLQMKCSLLQYTRTKIIRPLLTYVSPVWATASQTKIRKLQTFQNKFLRMSLKATWFIRNKQLHNDTGLPYLSIWIINQFKNFHDRLNKTEGALISKSAKKPPNQD